MSAKTPEQLNADTLFAFQMALKGHNQFEYCCNDQWHKTNRVFSDALHRIYHDIPEGWVRHDGEDWKGNGDVVIEEVMYCDGVINENKSRTAQFWAKAEINSWSCAEHTYRIYAYRLAKSPAIPEGFTAHDGEKCPVAADAKVEIILEGGTRFTGRAVGYFWGRATAVKFYRVLEKKVIPWDFADAPLSLKVKRKSDGEQFRCETYPSSALLLSKYCPVGMLKPSYETLATDYLQLDGTVCGTEVEQ